jgi:hypothetical protein
LGGAFACSALDIESHAHAIPLLPDKMLFYSALSNQSCLRGIN